MPKLVQSAPPYYLYLCAADDGPMMGGYQHGSREGPTSSSSDSAPPESYSHNYGESGASEMVYRRAY